MPDYKYTGTFLDDLPVQFSDPANGDGIFWDSSKKTFLNKQPSTSESGTWLPTIIGETAAGVTTYTTQNGYYQLTGKTVFACFDIAWSAMTGTGRLAISNLPYVQYCDNQLLPGLLSNISYTGVAPPYDNEHIALWPYSDATHPGHIILNVLKGGVLTLVNAYSPGVLTGSISYYLDGL